MEVIIPSYNILKFHCELRFVRLSVLHLTIRIAFICKNDTVTVQGYSESTRRGWMKMGSGDWAECYQQRSRGLALTHC